MPTFYSNKEIIDIPFPERIFNSYLKKVNIKSTDELNDLNIFWIAENAYKDFKKGTLSLDDFSSIGGYLFDKIKPESKSSRLASRLLDIGELNFYIRNIDSNSSGQMFTNFIIDIENYFNKKSTPSPSSD